MRSMPFQIRTFNTIASIMDFKYEVTEVNGTWNVLVKHLHDGKSVFGWAHFFLTWDRSKLIDFSASFDGDRYCFLVRTDTYIGRLDPRTFIILDSR